MRWKATLGTSRDACGKSTNGASSVNRFPSEDTLMTIELTMLGWSVVLGLVYVLIAAALGTMQRGLQWNVGNRDGETPPLTGTAARADRASRNFLETFAFFAVAVLVVMMAGRTGGHSALGVQLYFWARVAYLPIYLVGIPYLRTAVWTVSLCGLLLVLGALF